MTKANESSLQLELYRMMRLIRRAEELLIDEYHPADQMRCPIHFCVGQEAAPAALSQLLRPADVLMSHHRSHGYYLAKGAPLDAMVAEFYGRTSGSNGGLAGSQELSHDGANFFSGTILSGMFAMANGSAFAHRYRKTDNITTTIIGDGGMEEGIVYEALNLAAVFKLPVLFLCENNLYSAHTRLTRRTLSDSFGGRAASFGVPHRRVDGADVIALHEQLAGVVSDIRAGHGPAFVEVTTYRYCGHVGPENDDVLNYRPPEELFTWRQRDVVAVTRALLAAEGVAADQLNAIDAEIDCSVLSAIAAAKSATFPALDWALGCNLAGTYAPVAAAVIEGAVSVFEGAQNETRLSPY